ncbi:MAG TPA: DinB family protein [Thermoanaerobaculia bacterium]|nr:DinB family protein [Thermoanaerobaculia bacterium]
MSLAETLTTQFTMTRFIATANLAGITHEESIVRAAGGGNSINWVLGHVIATRCDVIPALHQPAPWSDAETRLYRRGMALAAEPEYLPLDELRRAFEESQTSLLAGIATTSEEQFAANAPFNPGGQPETLGSLLMKIAIHEAYHLGQTGILRRMLGKPGAIR